MHTSGALQIGVVRRSFHMFAIQLLLYGTGILSHEFTELSFVIAILIINTNFEGPKSIAQSKIRIGFSR